MQVAVHQFRYSIGFAIQRILASFCGWLFIMLLPALVVLIAPWWSVIIVLTIFLVFWLWHSWRYWQLLWDRSPQIEIFPTFLRAGELEADIPLSDIVHITGSELTSSGQVTASSLRLQLRVRGYVELDLLEMNVGVRELYLLLHEARQCCLAAPQPPNRRPSLDADPTVDLGEEIARFQPSLAMEVFEVVMAVFFLVGTPAFGLVLYIVKVPLTILLLVVFGILIPAVPLSILAFLRYRNAKRGVLVLYRDGLTYKGSALSYGEIWKVDTITTGGTAIVVLSLRDRTTLRLSDLRDTAGAGRRIADKAEC